MKNPILTLSLIALLSGEINNSYSQNSELPKDSKLVIYGESCHMSKKQKNFMINSVDSLKKEGYNYFAIELPAKEDSSIQCYLTSNKNYQDENIKKLLEWRPSNKGLKVAYNFYKKGFKVINIDEGEDYIDIFKVKWDDASLLMEMANNRDSCMAKNIERILEKDSSAKIVAYTGAFHVREIEDTLKIKERDYTFTYKYPPMAGILKKRGINPETICLIDENGKCADIENAELNKFIDKKIYLK